MRSQKKPALTVEQLRSLPAVVDLTTAARAFGFGRTTAYDLVKRGEFPVPLLRVGRRSIRVTRSDLLEALGVTADPPAALAATRD